MTILRQSATEIEVIADVMPDDRLRLAKMPNGELEDYLGNPHEGLNGAPMEASTVQSAAEIASVKAWLWARLTIDPKGAQNPIGPSQPRLRRHIRSAYGLTA
jgi:hypothetical protein